jgi:hypothetical protein
MKAVKTTRSVLFMRFSLKSWSRKVMCASLAEVGSQRGIVRQIVYSPDKRSVIRGLSFLYLAGKAVGMGLKETVV